MFFILGEIAAVTSGKPYFDDISARNVTTVVDDTAILKCRVKNKGDRTVSDFYFQDIFFVSHNFILVHIEKVRRYKSLYNM